MKKQTVMALALAAALAVPAAAQTTTNEQNTTAAPPSQTTEQTQTSQATQSAPATDQNMTARQPLAPPPHEGFWGHLNPFARKKYVQRQMGPIRDRVNELDELSAKNAKDITDVDQRAQEGIKLADAKASQADQHAIDAGNRAQQANQTAQQATTRLGTVENVVTNIDQYKPVTETEIIFRPGQTVLSKKAKDALDQMATTLADQKGYVIQVQGFSAGRGQTAIQHSHNMADSVVRYFVLTHQIPVYRIYEVGMGNAPVASAEGVKRVKGNRVLVSLLKNDLEQLSAQNTAAPTTEGGMTGTTAEPAQQQPQQQEPMAQPAAPTQTPPQQ